MSVSTFSPCLPCNLSTKGVKTPFLVSRDKMTNFEGRFHQHRAMHGVSTRLYSGITKRCRCSKKEVLIIQAIEEPGLNSHIISLNESGEAYTFMGGLYEFTRPHTSIGTIISVTSVSFMALNSWAQLTPAFLVEVAKAVALSLLMNFYVVGLNQIYDVELDKVNKPYLPLPSGVLSMNLAVGIVIGSIFLSLAAATMMKSPPLVAGLLTWGAMGSLYSLPFFKWKSNPVLAAIAIMFMRPPAGQIGLFVHMKTRVLGQPLASSRTIIFASLIVLLVTVVISMFKDLPDAKGDELFGIRTLSVRLGRERVFWLCISILTAGYGGAMVMGSFSTSLVNKIISVLGHFVLGSILVYRALRLDMDAKGSLYDFYMFIIKLFYGEYALIQFLR